jgi:hypothetical protein
MKFITGLLMLAVVALCLATPETYVRHRPDADGIPVGTAQMMCLMMAAFAFFVGIAWMDDMGAPRMRSAKRRAIVQFARNVYHRAMCIFEERDIDEQTPSDMAICVARALNQELATHSIGKAEVSVDPAVHRQEDGS